VQAEYHKYVVALLRPFAPLAAIEPGVAAGESP
jgi:hypothetical protein